MKYIVGEDALAYRAAGATVVGGCCRVQPNQIKLFRDALVTSSNSTSAEKINSRLKYLRIRPDASAPTLLEGANTKTLRGFPWVPSSEFLPESVRGAEAGSPLVVEVLRDPVAEGVKTPLKSPEEYVRVVVASLGEEMQQILDAKLHTEGVLLFRGFFGMNNTVGSHLERLGPLVLDTLVRAAGVTQMQIYSGGAALRKKIADHAAVFNASSELPEIHLEPHQEMSYQANFPTKFFLYCEKAAAVGGESGVTDMRKVTRQLQAEAPAMLAKLRDVGIRYVFTMSAKSSGYYCWRTQVAPTKEEVETILRENRGCTWVWGEGDRLTYWYRLPAFVRHPKTDEEVLFNQFVVLHESYFWNHPDWEQPPLPNGVNTEEQLMDGFQPTYNFGWRRKSSPPDEKLAPFTSYYGNGDPISLEDLAVYRRVVWENTRLLQLQRGEMLALDNLYCAHSRLGWDAEKFDRKLYVSLGDVGSFFSDAEFKKNYNGNIN